MGESVARLKANLRRTQQLCEQLHVLGIKSLAAASNAHYLKNQRLRIVSSLALTKAKRSGQVRT